MRATTCFTLSNFLYVPICGSDSPIICLTEGAGFDCGFDVPLEMLSENLKTLILNNEPFQLKEYFYSTWVLQSVASSMLFHPVFP